MYHERYKCSNETERSKRVPLRLAITTMQGTTKLALELQRPFTLPIFFFHPEFRDTLRVLHFSSLGDRPTLSPTQEHFARHIVDWRRVSRSPSSGSEEFRDCQFSKFFYSQHLYVLRDRRVPRCVMVCSAFRPLEKRGFDKLAPNHL